MPNNFPSEATIVVEVLSKLFEHQKQFEIARLLRSSLAQIEQTGYDNWNGGTYAYTLTLRIPIELFASIEPRLKSIETLLKEKFTSAFRNTENQHLADVVIQPRVDGIRPISTSAPLETNQIWGELPVRLFVSHVSQYRDKVGELKDKLETFGISAFVAHQDIEPASEWQLELEKALQSMHALVALLTHEFPQSKWTDQEVGYALGRECPVISVRLGIDPYGLIAKRQALAGDWNYCRGIASGVADVLLKQPKIKDYAIQGLVVGLGKSRSFADSKAIISKLEQVEQFSSDQFRVLERAISENRQVEKSFGVPERVLALKARVTR